MNGMEYARYPLDEDGLPTSWAAYRLISHMLFSRDVPQPVDDLATRLMMDECDVERMCERLTRMQVLQRVDGYPASYVYDLFSSRTDYQARVEASLVGFHITAQRLELP